MNKKLVFLGILLLVGLTLSGCVPVGGYGYGSYGYGLVMVLAMVLAMVIVILVATTTIITVMGILMDINNLAVTGTAIVDHGVEPAIGDERIEQGGRIIL